MNDSITTSAGPPATASLALDDTPAFWPLVALEAWVLTRDPAAVATICRATLPIDKVSILLGCRLRSDKTIQDVRRQIRRDMRSGKVPAIGDRGDGCETVPSEDLSKPFEYLPATCAYRVGKFENLGIRRDVAAKWWPPAAGQDAEDRREAAYAHGADVQQEPESILPSGAPGRPSSMRPIEAELDRRIAAGAQWPSKKSAAEELHEWAKENLPKAAHLPTPKAIKNSLGNKISVRSKTTP